MARFSCAEMVSWRVGYWIPCIINPAEGQGPENRVPVLQDIRRTRGKTELNLPCWPATTGCTRARKASYTGEWAKARTVAGRPMVMRSCP